MNGTDENGSMCDFKEFDLFADDIVKKLGRETTDELRVSPNSLCSKIQPPSPQESLYYGTYYSLQ